MPVNLPPLDPAQLQPIAGVRIGIAQAGVRKANRKDLTVFLLDEGASVPFIARYRKEVTGGLDDTQLRDLADKLVYLRELEARRATILQLS